MGLFEQLGPCYDIFMRPFEAWRLRAWRRRLVGNLQGRVLEVGAGTGLNLSHYPSVTEVVALDLTWEMLRYAWPRVQPRQRLLQADVEYLPFPDESFDAAVATLVFCSVPDAVRGLSEVYRVLKPGARFRLLEHVRGTHPWARRLTDTFEPIWYGWNGSCHLNRETARLLPEAGFEIVHREQYMGTLIELIEVVRR